MLGHKVYYEKSTGNVILTIPENPHENAIPTTKEQDFNIYPILKARDPESVDFIQFNFGEYQAEFQSARSWKVNIETNEIEFEFPKYEPPLTEQIEMLKQENEQLKKEKYDLEQQLIAQQSAINMLLGV